MPWSPLVSEADGVSNLMEGFYFFIHLFDRHLLNTYYVLSATNKADIEYLI